EREHQIADRETKAATKEAELNKTGLSLQAEKQELLSGQEQLKKDQAALAEDTAKLAGERAKLNEQAQSLAKQEAALLTREQDLRTGKENLLREQLKLTTDKQALQSGQKELEAEKSKLEEARKALQTEQEALSKQVAEAKTRGESLNAEKKSIDEAKTAAEKVQAEIKTQQAELSKQKAELDKEAERLSAESSRLDKDREQLRKERSQFMEARFQHEIADVDKSGIGKGRWGQKVHVTEDGPGWRVVGDKGGDFILVNEDTFLRDRRSQPVMDKEAFDKAFEPVNVRLPGEEAGSKYVLEKGTSRVYVVEKVEAGRVHYSKIGDTVVAGAQGGEGSRTYAKLMEQEARKLPAPESTTPDKASESAKQAAVEELKTQLAGDQSFIRLTDEARMKEALSQLTDRGLQRMPEAQSEKAEFLSKQIKAAMRKQLGAATDAQLPESLRKMEVKIVDSDAKTPRLLQAEGQSAVLEIPAKLLSENPKGVLVDAYAQASGLSMLDLLHRKGNTAATMRSLEPMLDKIAGQAEKIVGARSATLAAQEKPALTTEAAASDRKITLDPKKPLVTAWDGENLALGGEKFHVKSEIEKLEKERDSKVKELEEESRKANELAESTKNADDIARAKALETQLAVERQNLRVVSELKLAMNGQRGSIAQEKAHTLVKAAADKAIADRLSPKEGASGGSLSRTAAIGMVITTLAFMYVGNNGPAQADTYEGSFRTR
ncbi:MAG: hypothetical protein K2X27_03890, partial [Candidatus Obscuribacterales bacterium]|nr:hypothetical protein [Candidatus Obscuribacterales bacterium]